MTTTYETPVSHTLQVSGTEKYADPRWTDDDEAEALRLVNEAAAAEAWSGRHRMGVGE